MKKSFKDKIEDQLNDDSALNIKLASAISIGESIGNKILNRSVLKHSGCEVAHGMMGCMLIFYPSKKVMFC